MPLQLAERLREIGLTNQESRRTPPRHAALRDDPAALALRLFRDHAALTTDEAALLFGDAYLPPTLLSLNRSAYCIAMIEDLYLFSDWPGTGADEVLPPGETTAILFRAARDSCRQESVLDLGCGSGTLALLLARHACHVTGTDVNPRAITLSRLNAEINGIGNVDFLPGSLYEPVADRRFDLIVSQPPYVPQPVDSERHLFLHGGERGDELAREIAGGIASHLSDNGRAFVFSDWPLTRDQSLQERVPTAGLRTLLLASPPLTPESYARSYGDDLVQHFLRMGVTGVRQCLAVFEHGSGVTGREVLPHEWRTISSMLPFGQ